MTVQSEADGHCHDGLLVAAGLLVLGAPVFARLAGQLAALSLGALVTAVVLGWVAFRRRRARRQPLVSIAQPWVLAVLAVPAGLQLSALVVSPGLTLHLVIALGYVLAAGAAVTVAGLRSFPRLTVTRLFIALQAVAVGWLVMHSAHDIDVWVFLTDGARALLHGANPYAMTFPNIYSPHKAALFYGHGVVADGRVAYGFPYPPVSVLWAVPSYLLGDVRLAGVVALAALAWLLSGPVADRRSRAVAVLLVVAPSSIAVLTGSWTEPSVAALLGLAVWAAKTGRLAPAAVALGLFLVSKQYLAVTVPCLWLLRPLATRRRVGLVVAAGAVVTVPFVLVDPHAFWRSVVQFQLTQPFRADSLSLLVAVVNHVGWPGPAVYNLLPLAAGFAVAVAFAVTARPGPAPFAAGVALSLLVTVLLSKQAFLNYYFLVGAAFLVAAWAARVPGTRASFAPVPSALPRLRTPAPTVRAEPIPALPGRGAQASVLQRVENQDG